MQYHVGRGWTGTTFIDSQLLQSGFVYIYNYIYMFYSLQVFPKKDISDFTKNGPRAMKNTLSHSTTASQGNFPVVGYNML